MITGELKNKIDGLWDVFAAGGLVNPLDVIEQITYLMFIRDLDDTDNIRAKEAVIYRLKALEELGYIIPTLETQITVPDLGEYLKSKDQLTTEVIEAIKNEVYKRRSTDAIDELYFTTFNPGVECKNASTAFITAIFYKKGYFPGYMIDVIYDIIIKPDGSIVIAKYEEDIWEDSSIDDARGQLDTKKYKYDLVK